MPIPTLIINILIFISNKNENKKKYMEKTRATRKTVYKKKLNCNLDVPEKNFLRKTFYEWIFLCLIFLRIRFYALLIYLRKLLCHKLMRNDSNIFIY